MLSKETKMSHDANDILVGRFDSLDVNLTSSIDQGSWEKTKDVPKLADVSLAVDLNSTYPTAAFIAPSLGYVHCTALPLLKALEAMSELESASSSSSRYYPNGLRSSQFDFEWVKSILSHCKALLQLRLGKLLEDLRLHVSLTARGDTSDRDKTMLAKAAEDAGFISESKHITIRTIPTVEAVAIAAIKNRSATKGGPKFQDGDNILVVHYDGEVVDIQSYSISFKALPAKGYPSSGFQMTEMACGETVDCGKMVDQQFREWMQNQFGSSFLQLPGKDTGPDSQLMYEFSKVRCEYQTNPSAVYRFPLELQQPPDSAPYDRKRQTCQVQDSQMEMFFRSATDSLYESLSRHYNRVRTSNMSIKSIIFAGRPGISQYVEQQIVEWGSNWTGILPTNIQVFPIRLDRYYRLESNPEMTLEGAIHSNDPNVRRIHRSRAWYGFVWACIFENGDPEWSRYRDRFDDIDRCSVRICWQVKKNQLLDPSALSSENSCQVFDADTAHLTSNLNVYRCELDDPPRWIRFHEQNSNPSMVHITTATIEFTQNDFPLGEEKLCSDQVRRRRLNFKAQLSWAYGNGLMRIIALSADGQRTLGFASFVFPEGRE